MLSLLVALSLGWSECHPVISPNSYCGFHDGLHGQIVKLSDRIQLNPECAELYVQRADLYRRHRDWELAHRDLDVAQAYQPGLVSISYSRAQICYDLQQIALSAFYLEKYLYTISDDIRAFRFQAHLESQRGRHALAAEIYSKLIRLQASPQPQDFLDRAAALANLNDDGPRVALRSLEEGIQNLGSLIVLESAALDLEANMKMFPEALRRLNRILLRMPRKEKWLARKGDILKAAGRSQEACLEYEASLDAISKLPVKQRSTRAMVRLAQRAHQQILSLEIR